MAALLEAVCETDDGLRLVEDAGVFHYLGLYRMAKIFLDLIFPISIFSIPKPRAFVMLPTGEMTPFFNGFGGLVTWTKCSLPERGSLLPVSVPGQGLVTWTRARFFHVLPAVLLQLPRTMA